MSNVPVEPPPLALEALSHGDFDELPTPDAVMFGIFADWGIFPDDHYPEYDGEPIGDQFAAQFGTDEAVQDCELFDLIREIAWHSYRMGMRDAQVPGIHPAS